MCVMHACRPAAVAQTPRIACTRVRELPLTLSFARPLGSAAVIGERQHLLFKGHRQPSDCRIRSRQRTAVVLQAARTVEDWSSLAAASPSEEYVAEEDPVFQEDINRLCNVGLKAMLKEEGRAVREWQDELNAYGAHFAEEGNRDAAVFIFTLYEMSEHKLPTESLQLKGMYLKAFGKIFNVLEDSGWQLKSPDDESSDEAESP